MIRITEQMIEDARDLIANGTPEAIGYRILIKPIDSVKTLEQAEVEKYETLAQAGFETKTAHQADRESKGTHHGILAHVGEGAYKGSLEQYGCEWPQEGDVVIFDRYVGTEVELPPGSGDMYRFANDEAVLGRMVNG